jgi:hypothetical protein
MSGSARATVLSVGGFGAEVFAVSVYGSFALGSLWLGVAPLVAGLALPVLLVAAVTRRWLPPFAGPTHDPGQDRGDHEVN